MSDIATSANVSDEDVPIPDIGFSVAELEYLLSIAPGSSAEVSAGMLNIAPVPSVDVTILAGGAALLARGQLEVVDGGSFAPVDAALVVSFILTNAVRWTALSGANEASSDLGLFVESPHGGLIAQPRTLGTWWFIILDPDSKPSDIIVKGAFGLADGGDESVTVVQMVSLAEDRTFSFRRASGQYDFGYGPTGSDEPEKLQSGADADDVLAGLLAFIAEFPDPSANG